MMVGYLQNTRWTCSVKFGVLLLCAVAVLAACERRKHRVAFDGIYFNAKTSKVRKGGETFTVTIPKATQSVEGARAAAGYHGVRYCIENYGTSNIDWIVAPDDEGLVVTNDSLTVQGDCDP